MWTFRSKQIINDRAYWFAIDGKSGQLTWRQVINYWQNNLAFRNFFIETYMSTPFLTIRWETPAVTSNHIERPFEFVILNSPEIDLPQNASPFSSYFNKENAGNIVQFNNLGYDARLVVPCPQTGNEPYSHLASFSRHAPKSLQHALWREVGSAMQSRVNDKPVWLNTAGGGVRWLHIRLDDRPKYYGYQPYCIFG